MRCTVREPRRWRRPRPLHARHLRALRPLTRTRPQGVASGFRHVDVSEYETDPSGNILRPILTVWFSAESFACPVCGLRLDSSAEMTAAGMEETWDEGPEQVDDYSQPYDEDEGYERKREEDRVAPD